jgi:hypothetical protein
VECPCEQTLSLRGGMESVGLEEGRVGADFADKAWDQQRALLIGDSQIEVGKTRCIVGPVVGGDIHPEEHDLSAGLTASPDDFAEVLLGVVQWLAAERVVAAEFDDEDLGWSLEDPIDSGKTTGRRIATDSGIDDGDIESLGPKEGFGDRGEGLGLGETEPRGQAVAEYDDAEFGFNLDNRGDRR